MLCYHDNKELPKILSVTISACILCSGLALNPGSCSDMGIRSWPLSTTGVLRAGGGGGSGNGVQVKLRRSAGYSKT